MEQQRVIKDIKDYLPYYIGQLAEISNLSQRMIAYGFEDGQVKINGYLIDTLEKEDAFTIKPILRKLSSMTEEEIKELESTKAFQRPSPVHALGMMVWTADSYVWAMQKGFDLFGLIDSELAIEKK
jgi:hypothetical protein